MNVFSSLKIAAVLAASSVGASAQLIDTTTTWNGSDVVNAIGESNTATYGQTFRPVGGGNLTSFSFWLKSFGGPDGLDFAAYVMEWDSVTHRATGSILYQSTQQLLAFNTPALTQVTFNTGGVALDGSKSYIAFLSASNFFDGSPGHAEMGYLGSDVYADGGFYFFNNGSNFGLLTTASWETFVGGGTADTAFTASFGEVTPGAVPEPSTYGLLGAGALAGLIAIRRRKMQK